MVLFLTVLSQSDCQNLQRFYEKSLNTVCLSINVTLSIPVYFDVTANLVLIR